MLFSGILIFLMAWLQTYGVTKRYIFHAPDPTAYELSTMFLLFCGVLAHWVNDRSPKQEDTLALLDQSLRMFVRWLHAEQEPDPRH